MPSKGWLMRAESLRIMPETLHKPLGEPAMVGPEPLPMLTAAELAHELRVSLKTLRRLDTAAKIPRGTKIGHAKRWPRETVLRWLRTGAPCRREWESFGDAPARRRTV